jgi:hypothetical protein
VQHVDYLGKTREGNRLSHEALSDMLRNVAYYGRVRVESWDLDVQGDFEPIVSSELFERVQDALDNSRRHATRPTSNDEKVPLRRFIRCTCGRALTDSSPRSGTKGRRYDYYHCYVCRGRGIRREELERLFCDLLRQLQARAEYWALFDAIVDDVWREHNRLALQRRNDLERTLAELRQRRQKLIDRYMDDKIDDETYQEQKV